MFSCPFIFTTFLKSGKDKGAFKSYQINSQKTKQNKKQEVRDYLLNVSRHTDDIKKNKI